MRGFFAAIAVFFLILTPYSALARDFGAVALDPGHGGYDSGLRAGDHREKDIALDIARRLNSFLKGEGKGVRLTREVDRYLSFTDRRDAFDRRPSNVMVSIHLTSSDSVAVYVAWYGDTEAELSLEDYYLLDSRQRRYLLESRGLANAVGDALSKEFGVKVRYGELPLPLLRTTGAPAILVELPSKGMKFDEETRQRLALAIGIGLQIYGQQ